jgi:hypothetical protein
MALTTPNAPRLRIGQYALVGRHTVVCGDGTDDALHHAFRTHEYPSAIIDPPYDTDLVTWRVRHRDVLVFTDHMNTLRALANWEMRYRNLFVWDTMSTRLMPDAPLQQTKVAAWFGSSDYRNDAMMNRPPDKNGARKGERLSTLYSAPISQIARIHPHAKPIDWVRLLIANCTRDHVVDYFAGSGTTLFACEALRRKSLLFETNPETCSLILERAAQLGLPIEVLDI